MTDAPNLPGYAHVYSGKVRDLYAPLDDAGNPRDDQVLLVASDRISAFDYVLSTPIPDKGAVLTQLSLWWFEQMADLVPNHVISTDVPEAVAGRAVLVERLDMVPLEAIARAYLTGGGLAEYRDNPAHRRAKLVSPTAAGLAAVRAINPGHRAAAIRLATALDPARWEHALTALRDLSAALDELDDQR